MSIVFVVKKVFLLLLTAFCSMLTSFFFIQNEERKWAVLVLRCFANNTVVMFCRLTHVELIVLN